MNDKRRILGNLNSARITTLLLATAIILCTAIAFSPSLINDFVPWDDPLYLLDNSLVRDFNAGNIGKIFTTPILDVYTPLTILSYNFEYHFAGYEPFVYHLDNLLLHLAVTLLVFIFARKLGLGLLASFWAGLLFGIHPMHVEAVAWVTARKDALYALFYMCALLSYLRYLKKKSAGEYLLITAFALLSVLAKPMAISLPLILLLCDWSTGRQINSKTILEKAPIALIVAAVAWLTYILNARIPGQNIFEAALIWAWTVIFYIKTFFWPVNLIPLYHTPEPVSLSNPAYSLSVVGIFIIVLLLIRCRRNKWIVFGFLYYFLSIFFLLRYDNLVDKTIVADRFMYLPSMGFCLMAGAGVEYVWKGANNKNVFVKCLIGAVVLLATTSLGMKTYFQCKVWRDGISLWTNVMEHFPDEISAYNNRGITYHNKGKFSLALKDFDKAIALNSQIGKSYLNRGVTYAKIGNFDQAIADYNEAMKYTPESPDVFNNRGAIFLKQQKYAHAFEDFNKAIELNPSMAEAYNNRGRIYSLSKQYELSLKDYTKAISLDSRLATAYNNRGADYYEMKKYTMALQDFSKAIEINPRYRTAIINRGNTLLRLGRRQEALMDDYEAKRLNKDHEH